MMTDQQPPSPLGGEGRGEGKKAFARSLRANQTDAERRLWQLLRSRQLNGLKFRRQHPVGPYIVDFCCLEQRLIVELDGGQHADATRNDEVRTHWLSLQGYRVLRFWNHEALIETSAVLEAIQLAMSPLTLPLSLEGRGDIEQKL